MSQNTIENTSSVSRPQEEQEVINIEEVNKEIIEKMKPGLSIIQRVGQRCDYAYVMLDCSNKEVTALYASLDNFINVKYLDLSKNAIKDISGIRVLKNLVTVDLSENEIESADVFAESNTNFYYLRQLNLRKNKLKVFRSMTTNHLTSLNLNSNGIESLDLSALDELVTLDIRANKIKTINNITSASNLKDIYGAENSIEDILQFKDCLKLNRLHLRKNLISTTKGLTFNDLPKLEYLNLRENTIANTNDIDSVLELVGLSRLSFLNNPVGEDVPNMVGRFVEKFLINQNYIRLERANMLKFVNKVCLDDEFFGLLRDELDARKEEQRLAALENVTTE